MASIDVEIDNGIGWVTLNDPATLNAFDRDFYEQYPPALRRLESDDSVKVIVVKGAGRAWSSGGSAAEGARCMHEDSGHFVDGMRQICKFEFQPLATTLHALEKPTIAMLNGAVAAEAIGVALAADIRIGDPSTYFVFSQPGTANVPYMGELWYLPRIVGLAAAKRLLFLQSRIEGKAALDMGLVDVFADEESLVDTTRRVASNLAHSPLTSIRLTKMLLNRSSELSYETHMELVAAVETIIENTHDHLEFTAAFREKRAPEFTGK